MENLIIYSATYKVHVELVRAVLKTASDHNVGVNRAKTTFAEPTEKFAGYIVSEEGFRPSPDFKRAIREFPQPRNVTELRSFYGLCQQVGNFSSKIATTLAPLSPFLKKNLELNWGTQQESAFQIARKELAQENELAFYNPNRITSLHVDASRLQGLGFILKQQQPANGIYFKPDPVSSHRPNPGTQ